MKKILLIVDKPNWAYDSIAKSLIKFNNHINLSFDIDYIKNPNLDLNKIEKNYDLLFFIGWQSILKKNLFGKYKYIYSNISKSKIICGIHSHHSWDNKKTNPNKDIYPSIDLINKLNSFKAVNIVSTKLFNIFKSSGLKNGKLTQNGVDTNLFKHLHTKREKDLIVGYSGSKKHDWRKGITDFIIPACNIDGVKLNIAAPQINYISHDEMASFYQNIDIYLCASSSEGFSLSVLEALACGKPVISTRVGGCVELIKDNYNGFLVDRDILSIQNKILFYKKNKNEVIRMGNNASNDIIHNWSWEVKSIEWYKFIFNSINN